MRFISYTPEPDEIPRKRPFGRPTKYDDSYPELLLKHFELPAWDIAVNGELVEGFFPTLAGFCTQIGVTQKTLLTWASEKLENGEPKYPDFLKAYELVKEYQEDYFVKGYMKGKYTNPAVGALIAKNLMDWKDKKEVESNVTSTSTITSTTKVEGLSALLDKALEKFNKPRLE